ncbi:MAG TPA: PAS domain S-box protein [Polaromonas sp.]|uniref:PAS domain S-box protein n=1 Tax=Polaromonas sp. TaxID=1869339 RepID=UPI002D38B887|nr:PAS domain S-box protein [Polaromonas sp.]HYW56146.1 PAS domain S-box protein [Polaromonas sp.]
MPTPAGASFGDSALSLNLLLHNLPGMVYRCLNDADWTMIFISSGALALTGHPPEKFAPGGGVTFAELIHPDDRDGVQAGVQKAISEMSPFRMTYRIFTADGTLKWVFEQGSAVHSASGDFDGLEGFITDITERKEAEQALQQSEQRFRASSEQLASQSETLTTITESLGAYVDNGDWKSAFGRLLKGAMTQTQSEYGFIGVVVDGQKLRVLALEGIVWDRVTNREFYERAMHNYEQEGYLVFERLDNLFGKAVTSGQVVIANEPDHHANAAGRPQGHPPMHSFLGVPIKAGGEVCGVVALANRVGGYSAEEQSCIEALVKYAGGICVTYLERERAHTLALEREKAHQDLFASETRFRELAANIDEVFYSFDAKTSETIYISPAYETVWGRSCESLYADPRSIRESFHPEDTHKIRDAFTRQRSGKQTEVEFRIRRPDGQERWISDRAYPVLGADGGVTRIVGTAQDITARRVAEQALADSEKRYETLFESGPTPMWVFDEETRRIVAVNRATAAEYGYSESELLSMSLYDLRPEEDRELLDKLLALPPINLKVDPRAPVRHKRKDGSVFWARAISRYVTYAGRQARFVVAYDISDQVKAEESLQNHLFTLQRAADAAQVITAHQTLKATIQEVADQARGVIGAHQAVVTLALEDDSAQTHTVMSLSDKYTGQTGHVQPLDVIGLCALVCEANRPMRLTQAELETHPRWRRAGPDESVNRAMRGWLAVPLTGRDGRNIGLLQLSDKYEGEFSLQDEYVAVELAQLASIAIENARLFEQVKLFNANLERKVAERTAALSRQEALFRALAEQAPEVVWTAEVHGGLSYVNRRWYEMMGGTADDWLGTRWYSAVHPADREEVAANWDRCAESGAVFTGIRRLLAVDGTYHTMSYRASPVRDDDQEILFWVGIDSDITELKAIETALRVSNQELETFSYSVSHDLRSPLNTVNGFSSLLARHLDGSPDAKVKHYITRIQAGVGQMGQLIEGLLDLAQVSRAALRREDVDLSEMATNILEHLQARDPERVVHIDIESGLSTRGDTSLLRAAMENLLGNAWKFSSRQPEASISVGYSSEAGAFYVRDNGAGFDMAYADKLFGTFQRLHAVTEFPGTGIGLATVNRIVLRHGGRIWADSAPGAGATFFIALPGPAPSASSGFGDLD